MRIARGKELDQEKVYAKVLQSLKEHKTQQTVVDLPLLSSEEALLWYVVYNKARYSLARELDEVLKLNTDEPETFLRDLVALSPVQKAYMLRRVMLDQFGGNYPASIHAHIIQRIAGDYGDIDLAAFEKDQQEIQSKREARQQEKIKILNMQLTQRNETQKKGKLGRSPKARKTTPRGKTVNKKKVRKAK